MTYSVKVTPRAWSDIQTQVTYYEMQQSGLGERFLADIRQHEQILKQFPMAQIRYGTVRCVPLSDFPFMLHFTVNEVKKTVTVRALLHASRNPDSNWLKGSSYVSEPDYLYHATPK